MEAPRSKKWIDGKNETLWPIGNHIGWAVQTAGFVFLDDLDPMPSNYNYGSSRVLYPKTKAVLKDIDPKGYAILYSDAEGVLRIPQELLEPVGR